jgi:hypothetical protein
MVSYHIAVIPDDGLGTEAQARAHTREALHFQPEDAPYKEHTKLLGVG